MKIAMINFSGNVGKSTLAQHMILPRIKDAVFIPVESINADDSEVESVRGKEFGDLTEYLATQDAAVVDVGARRAHLHLHSNCLGRNSACKPEPRATGPRSSETSSMNGLLTLALSAASMYLRAAWSRQRA